MLSALVAGFLMAFFGSIPPTGPVAVLVLQRGVCRRYREGLAIAAGAAIAEGTYAGLAVFGLSAAFERLPALAWASRIAGIAILLGLGVHFLRSRDGAPEAPDPAEDERRGVPRALLLGLSISAANPLLIVTWSTSVALLFSFANVRFDASERVAFALAVAAGIAGWFRAMLAVLRRHDARFTVQVAGRIVRGAGFALVAMALLVAGSLILRAALAAPGAR